MRARVAWAPVGALLLGACALVGARSRAPAPERVTLLVTSQLQGALEPCGCSASMRGGLSRVAALVAGARAEGHPVFLLDVGDGLFPSLTLPEAAVAQQERKAQTIALALGVMGVSARAPGPLDDARGEAFRTARGLPELAPGGVRFLEAGAFRLALVRAGTLGAARTLGAGARASGAGFVVAVVDLPFEALLPAVGEAPELDLVLPGTLASPLAGEESRALGGEATRLVQVQSKGRSLARVDLVLREPGRGRWLEGSAERTRTLAGLDERIELVRADVNGARLGPELKALKQAKLEELIGRRAALSAEPLPEPASGNAASLRFLPVEPTVARDPGVAALERVYNQEVGELNLRWAQEHGQDCPAPSPTLNGLIGTALCGSCHPEALKTFQATRHPHAYEALEREGKQYHLDCVACHVAGWQQPGGVCRVDRTEGRREVTCESCHGPGFAHLVSPVKATIRRSASPEVCTGCHDHDNSPAFDYPSYVARIKGPGHAQDGGVSP